jgi:hypothetical protein
MEDNPTLAPAGWLEVLAESDADVAAGQTVPTAVIGQGLRDSIARIEAKLAANRQRGATSRV